MKNYEDFGLPRPRTPHREIAVLGGSHEDDLAIAVGYLDAAEITARHWIGHPNDGLPLPILYMYRHSIELSLKWLIRMAARCALRNGYSGEENLTPAKVEERLIRTHNIKTLADCLNRYLAHLDIEDPNKRIDPESWKLLQWLDSEDATGETYRYAVVGHGDRRTRARPVQRNINFYEQINELHQLAHLLCMGYSGWLGDYEQTQKEWLQEMRYQAGC